MRTNLSIAVLGATLIATVSCKSKAQKDAEKYMTKIQETVKENSPAKANDHQNTNAASFSIPQGMENIVGEWERVKLVGDRNDNQVIDADEEKDAITNIKDYLKLNANGTCKYTIAELDGRYEIVTKDDGRKKLVMYDEAGTEIMKSRYIISVTDKELVINRIIGGSDIEVFERK